jgi:hypothetical protein
VTGIEPAEQVRVPGATVAGDVTPRRTPSAEAACSVIDVGFVDDGSSANGACRFGYDVTDTAGKAAIAAQFEVVRKAREQIQAVQQARDKRRDTKPSADTVAQYQKKLGLLDKKAWRDHAESASPLCAAIASLSGNTQSFYAYRTVAAWREINAVRRLLMQQDALQRRGNCDDEWLGCIDDLRAHCDQLREIQALNLDMARTMANRTPETPNSKKNVLRHAQHGWRERFRKASAKSKRYAAACVLLDICGMRPKEIENGVTVRHRHGIVGVKIEGAKVRDIAGQPWRVLFVPADKFPAWFLDELGHGHAKVYAAPAAAMRSYLYRLSTKVFPPRPGAKQQLLSAYVLRHAVATDLRQEGWSEEELAAVLGERVAETARHYGLYRRGAKGGRQPEAAIVRDKVKTAIPVRARDKHWLNQVRPKRNVRGV